MRPLKLTMTAFGPYAGKEIIDFTKLLKKNIFLITGPTGAGKTTIFDGISYAVFGSASSDERDGESLRSHFAKDDIITSVELEFELKGKNYYIKRIPKQQKKKSKGEGFTEQKTEAYLELINEGDDKPLYVSGVQPVNDKIAQILGINCAQFRQIMMIPQGEFRKLITEDSRNREEILQKIFGTEGYKKIQDALGEKSKKLLNDAKEYKNRIDENIHNLNVNGNEALEQFLVSKDINYDELVIHMSNFIIQDSEKEKKSAFEIQKIDKAAADKNKEIFQGIEINKKFELRNSIEENRNMLLIREPEINQKKLILIRGRKALTLIGLEENYKGKQISVETREKELQRQVDIVKAADIRLKDAEVVLNGELEKESLRNQLLKDIALLQGFIPKVKELDHKADNLKNLVKQSKEFEKLVLNKKTEVDIMRNSLKNINEEQQNISSAKDSLAAISVALEEKNKFVDKLKNLYEENEKLSGIRNECLKVQKNHQTVKEKYNQIKEKYENLQDMFFKGQAGFFASRLEDGKPCPVCGSIEHPNLAQLSADMPDETALNLVKDDFLRAQDEYNISSEALNKLLGQGKLQKESVDKLKAVAGNELQEEIITKEKEELSNCLKKYIKDLNEVIIKLKSEKNDKENLIKREQALIEEKGKLNIKIDEAILAFDGFDKKLRNIETELKSEQRLMDVLQMELPKAIDSEEKLAAAIDKAEKEFHTMKEAMENASNSQREANSEHIKALTSKTSAEINLKEAMDELAELNKKFNIAILQAGFESLEDYYKNKLTENQIENLENEISEFNEKLKSLSDSLIKAEKEIEGLNVIEINVLNEQLAEISMKRTIAENEKIQVYARRNQNEKAMESIKSLMDMLLKTEEEYKVIGDLANVARGFNSEKITFERYVLAAFFDDIIDAANSRFIKMTSSRYEMSRIKERSKGNAQSGLEIEVLDNYTGRTRHIKTLSGGESFKASLSLALGLAEVVQCYAGGISMDTMFIDEGFGTLDPESLDNAVQTLMELQSTGRLVGIISHVPELKERIDARLEIIPGREGSYTVFNV